MAVNAKRTQLGHCDTALKALSQTGIEMFFVFVFFKVRSVSVLCSLVSKQTSDQRFCPTFPDELEHSPNAHMGVFDLVVFLHISGFQCLKMKLPFSTCTAVDVATATLSRGS